MKVTTHRTHFYVKTNIHLCPCLQCNSCITSWIFTEVKHDLDRSLNFVSSGVYEAVSVGEELSTFWRQQASLNPVDISYPRRLWSAPPLPLLDLKSHNEEKLLKKWNSHIMYTTVFCVRLAVLEELNRQQMYEKMLGACFRTWPTLKPFIPFICS
jgi:hypothetical protein